MSIRLYHPELTPPDNECEVQNEAQAAILADSGWLPAPEPEAVDAAHAPEPVTYAPVEAKPAKAAAKTTKKSTDD